MVNKILCDKDLDKLNKTITEYNKKGWVVKQIVPYGDVLRSISLFVLLEHPGTLK